MILGLFACSPEPAEVPDTGDASGCGVADYTSPRGVAGIDNGFALLVPALEVTEAGAVEGLLVDAIHTGELLIATDGELEWSQTFDRDPDVEQVMIEDLRLEDGRVEVRPVSLDVPISILDQDLLFGVEDGAFAVEPQADGSFTGVFGEGVATEALIELVRRRGRVRMTC